MDRILNARRAGGPDGSPAPTGWLAVTAILLLGFGGTLAGHMTQPTEGGPVAVIVPPWRPTGFAFADQVGLPAMDLRWGGWLVVFPATEDAQALARMGPFVMPAGRNVGCWLSPSDPGAER